jgi:superfamily II DNA or RNA helicase
VRALPGTHALHALWRPDHRLALWAERSVRRRPAPAEPTGHPFACPAPVLQELLGSAGAALRWLASSATDDAATLLLPSAGGRPLASPELLGPSTPGELRAPEAVEPVAWRVPTLVFAPAPAAQLLGELFDPYPWTAMVVAELEAGGSAEVWFGSSLRWLIAVHDLAWRTARAGRVLPALVTQDGGPHARWRPVPDRTFVRAVDLLAKAAPPAALADREPDRQPEREPADAARELVAEVVEALADAEVRATLDEEPPLLPAGRGQPSAASRAVRLWLQALVSTSARIRGADPAELADLERRLARWYRSTPDASGPLRLLFRLAEPLGPDPTDPEGWTSDDHWRVEFLLQSAREPAVTVEAAAFWSGGDAHAALARTVPAPVQAFLDELDRAVRCYPGLREAFRDPSPAELTLTRAGALEFLRDGAPLLAGAGFGVLLPSWWQHPARLGLRMTARLADPGVVATTSLIDRDAVVGFDWQAAVGAIRLSAEELGLLAAATVPLVRLRGRWTVVDPDQIAAALDFLKRQGSGTATAADVLRETFTAEPTAGGLPVLGVDADGWLGDLLAGGSPDRPAHPMDPLRLPAGFAAQFRAGLRPYQERGLAWLATLSRLGLGAVLADDMGLGKTVQTLALLMLERVGDPQQPSSHPNSQRSRDGECTLLICPMSLVGNWQREAARFTPGLRVHVHHGSGRRDGDLRRAVHGADLVITTFAVAQRDLALLQQVTWRRVVVDEAQHIKNRAAGASRAIRSLPARHRIALTGTPVENRLADLHAVLDFANPGLFGSPEQFKERYSVPIERHQNERAAAELRRRTQPLMLRRVKTDPAIIADLPDKVEMSVLCNLTVEQAALYRAVVSDLMGRLRERHGIARKGLVLAALSKLKQICNHPAQFLRDGSRIAHRSGKVARLEEILEEALAEGDKALCFTQFAGFGALLQPHLVERLGQEVIFLHGGLARKERERLVTRFQDADGPAVFLLSLKAGGTGLNLTAANHVIHLDRWWNPAVEEQATDRAFRIGQRRDVQVRRLVCVGTIEERIDEIITSKRSLAEAVVGAGDGWLTELPAEALAELVSLSDDAVSEDPDD